MYLRSITAGRVVVVVVAGWLCGSTLALPQASAQSGPAQSGPASSRRQVSVLKRSAKQHISREEYATAARQLGMALELRPTDLAARRLLAKCLAAAGDYVAADQQFRYVLRRRPRDVDAHYGIAWINEKTRRYEHAIAMYRATIRLEPAHSVSLNNLAWLLATSPFASQRNGDQAVMLAKLAIELRGGMDWHTADTLAAAYAEQGDFDQAVQALRSGLTTVPRAHEAELQARLQLYEQQQPYRLPE